MGFTGYPDTWIAKTRNSWLTVIRSIVGQAPLYQPTMPRSGKPMSVRMTNCGELGWVTDRENGYRYQNTIR